METGWQISYYSIKKTGTSIQMLGLEVPTTGLYTGSGLEKSPTPSKLSLEKLIDAEVDYLETKFNQVIEIEAEIDDDERIYMFTWSPDRKELPDADFQTQHRYNIPIIASYLGCFKLAIACVEATQVGIPHYHGWYQLSSDPILERKRLAVVKTLERFGNLKITKSMGHYKKGSWSRKANCLYYYKKDLLQAMSWIETNPITSECYDNTDWKLHVGLFSIKGRSSIADLEEKISLREFYEQFYNYSL